MTDPRRSRRKTNTGEETSGQLRPQVADWRVEERGGVKRLQHAFRSDDFAQALAFTNKADEAAEEEHNPALSTEWGKVPAAWWTHKIGGLRRNDFVMAARTDELHEASREETSA